ncbi:patatin-like phospholipase family protein [Phreatobacter aquaticus]|uniref:Patatin-like phospholipase family protein n=1 Tax=Phreatobacter aquaticus TaxID=2570229 RepID=A0A4D7QPE9_9HYPH|nr:patatin-like phospholipase family protein [Phreatobacter aquaticus]QCK86032.1 patatin-like phospholipase family protein [Phreatobacter aquaticus]
MTLPEPRQTLVPSGPPISLVLGGGGAKGLAHVIVLEALDELGLKPAEVIGTSIGAIIGACYCAGMSGQDLRTYALDVFRMKPEVLRRVFAARVGRFTEMLTNGFTNPVLIDPQKLLDGLLPSTVPQTFEELAIPLKVVAADYYARVDVTFADGPLIPAVAASMAIPGAFRPVLHRGRVLIDGGTINPVAVDQASQPIVIAVDVLDGSAHDRTIDETIPDPWQALFGSVTLMMQVLSGIRLAEHRPTIHLRPPVEGFRVLDFFKVKEIFAACEPIKDNLKRRIELALDATPAELLESRKG